MSSAAAQHKKKDSVKEPLNRKRGDAQEDIMPRTKATPPAENPKQSYQPTGGRKRKKRVRASGDGGNAKQKTSKNIGSSANLGARESIKLIPPDRYRWDVPNDDEEGNGEDIEEIEGFMHDGTLLLRNKKKGKIFSSERDESGELIQVGSFSDEDKPVFTSYIWKLASLPEPSKAPLNFFVTDASDHCETSIKAYLDIKQPLEQLASLISKVSSSSELRLWDPFFCTGRMRAHMISIGFPHIHNENEDFYQVKDNPPRHDVLVTNPPYSQDHIPKLLQYCIKASSPSCLLLPSYVGTKDYFQQYDDKDSRFFFIVPKTGRYTYHNPGLDGAKVGRTAPFQSFWFVAAKQYRSEMLRKLSSLQSSTETTWELHKSINRIPARFFDADGAW